MERLNTRRKRTLLRFLAAAVLLGAGAAGGWGPRGAAAALPLADTRLLRPAFARALGAPSALRVDAVPDLSRGSYARISLYAENAEVAGMRINRVWIRLVGVRFDPGLLRSGTLKVLGLRGSAVYTRVAVADMERYLDRRGMLTDAKVTPQGRSITASGLVSREGVAVPVRLRGAFSVNGTPQVFFRIQQLIVNSVPVPTAQVDAVERQINPVFDLRGWPVDFPIRVFRQVGGGFVVSSLADAASRCDICGAG